MFLKISQNSQENTCARVSFLIKLQTLTAILLKKKLYHRCFPVNFVKFIRALFLQNASRRLLLMYVYYKDFNEQSQSKDTLFFINMLLVKKYEEMFKLHTAFSTSFYINSISTLRWYVRWLVTAIFMIWLRLVISYCAIWIYIAPCEIMRQLKSQRQISDFLLFSVSLS